MNASVLDFLSSRISLGEVRDRRVLEVGSRDVNGSPRSVIMPMEPSKYIGADLIDGPGVDVICAADRLVDIFGRDAFDMVVSTEMLEHVENWRAALRQMKRVLRPGGVLLLTTRSPGFKYHPYPEDFWRFTRDDMKMAFADMAIDVVLPDIEAPGVFVRAKKPLHFSEIDLSHLHVEPAPRGDRR